MTIRSRSCACTSLVIDIEVVNAKAMMIRRMRIIILPCLRSAKELLPHLKAKPNSRAELQIMRCERRVKLSWDFPGITNHCVTHIDAKVYPLRKINLDSAAKIEV